LALARTDELRALSLFGLGIGNCLLVDLDEIVLFLDRLGMLVWFVIAWWEAVHFLYRFFRTFNCKLSHVCLRRFKLVEWTVDDDLLANVVRGGQIHWCLPLVVFETSPSSVLDQERYNV
jgi:hypothetical protein